MQPSQPVTADPAVQPSRKAITKAYVQRTHTGSTSRGEDNVSSRNGPSSLRAGFFPLPKLGLSHASIPRSNRFDAGMGGCEFGWSCSQTGYERVSYESPEKSTSHACATTVGIVIWHLEGMGWRLPAPCCNIAYTLFFVTSRMNDEVRILLTLFGRKYGTSVERTWCTLLAHLTMTSPSRHILLAV